jgi:membrane associated rhomboid family serine protease
MKKIKNYIKNLPKAIKVIVGINIGVYLVSLISINCFSYDINNTFGAYPTCSEHFNYYRVVAFMFSHALDVTHIISNIIIFILFAPFVSNKLGNKNTFLLYIFSGLMSFVLFNNQKNYENFMIKKDMSKIGIDIKKIKQSSTGSVDILKFKNLSDEQFGFLRDYPHTNSKLIGASGSIFSFIFLFLFFSVKQRKNIFLSVVSILLITQEIIFYFFRDVTTSGTTFGHLGGIIGGMIFLLFFTLVINKKRDS